MALRKKIYREGTWVSIPLKNPDDRGSDAGWALALITHRGPLVSILVQVIDKLFSEQAPTEDDVAGLSQLDAGSMWKTSDHGVLDGRWPMLGVIADFDQDAWPIPIIYRKSGGECYRIDYGHRPFAERHVDVISEHEYEQHAGPLQPAFNDAITSPAGALEIDLYRLLNRIPEPRPHRR